MSLRFSIRVLDHLTHRDYAPVTLQEMARQLRVPAADFDEFRDALGSLEAEGKLERGDDDKWRLPAYGDEVVGVYKQNARGFGFVDPDQPMRGGSVFIPLGAQGDAVSGDQVRCAIAPVRRGSDPGRGPSGRVVEVLERGQREFVGVLRKRVRQWLVEPDGRALRAPVVDP